LTPKPAEDSDDGAPAAVAPGSEHAASARTAVTAIAALTAGLVLNVAIISPWNSLLCGAEFVFVAATIRQGNDGIKGRRNPEIQGVTALNRATAAVTLAGSGWAVSRGKTK
jgi:hypothetical protein